MAKQFIRHLEYYGFPDQNNYSSDLGNVDLSDIIKKNKEQDEEIEELEGEKAEKADLDALSGTVESLIIAQTEINQNVAESISGITADIEEQKTVDDEFATQISALTDSIDDTNEALSAIGDIVGEVSDALSGLTDELNDFEASVEEIYAKKDDTYTKEEIDEVIDQKVDVKLTEYATKEWVEAQNYLTDEEAETKFAKTEELEELSNTIESSITAVYDAISDVTGDVSGITEEINTLRGDIESALSEVNESISEINESVDEINDKISGITEDVSNIDAVTSANTEAINELNEDVAENVEAINNLDNKINEATSTLTEDIQEITEELGNKANSTDLQDLHAEMNQGLGNLELNKADKTDLNAVSGAVDSVDGKIDAEITRSKSVDTAMQSKIDLLDGEVHNAVETVGTFNDRIADLETGLSNEIENRENNDNALIGTTGDSREANTINGAKNYAAEMKRQAVSEAEVYTDSKVSAFSTELNNLEDEFNTKLTTAATTAYVESRLSEQKGVIKADYETKIQNETDRATGRENEIIINLSELANKVTSANTEISHNATRINAITSWDGSDPAQYTDEGNGVLDVLHREFHALIETLTQKGILP